LPDCIASLFRRACLLPDLRGEFSYVSPFLPFAFAAAFAFRTFTDSAAHRFRWRTVAFVGSDGQPAKNRRAESKLHKRLPAPDPFRRTSLDSSTPSSRNW